MNTIVKAGAEELIWVVVGVFWVIAQIVGGAAKKKKGPSRPLEERSDGEVPADPFADLMRKLTGVQEIKAPPPPRSIERAELPPVDAVSPPRSLHVQNAVRTPHLQEETAAPAPTTTPVEAIAEVNIRPTMSSFQSAMPAMKLPSMKMSFQPSGKSTGTSPMLGKIINPSDKQSLRRAMLSHIVLGKPRGLESRDWNEGMLE